ncbi:hypothetical protein UlMin_013345 [Ulmus minor]
MNTTQKLLSKNKQNAIAATTSTTPTGKPEMSDASLPRALSTTSVRIMALDGIVNVNSLFTLALFLGLSWYPTTDPLTTLIGNDTACAAGTDIAEGLISFHVYSFSSFLFSSLIAFALKQVIKISRAGSGNGTIVHMAHVNRVALRLGTVVSGLGSVFGCGFLMLALVDLVQIKLGTLACGSLYTVAAVGPLVVLVPLALLIYVSLLIHAFIL